MPVVDDGVAVAVELGQQLLGSAMPTALAMPWPSGPVVVSTPGVTPVSDGPASAVQLAEIAQLAHRQA